MEEVLDVLKSNGVPIKKGFAGPFGTINVEINEDWELTRFNDGKIIAMKYANTVWSGTCIKEAAQYIKRHL